jgi:hypothetical protein
MNSQEWLAYFEQNRRDRLPIAWDEPVGSTTAAVETSLGRFQLGESSNGRRLRWLARRTGDATYAAAINLFIGEEQAHARLLGRVLDRQGAPRLKRHWTDWLFRRCRHLLGVDEEIAVLLMAEIIALKYYSVVRNGTTDAALRRVCEQILHDEKFHVRFHCDYLHRRLIRAPRVVAGVLTAMFAGASAVVAWDHRDALVKWGSSAEDFLDESWRNFAAVRQAILTGESFVWSRATQQAEAPAVRPPPSRPTRVGAYEFARTAAQCCRRAW